MIVVSKTLRDLQDELVYLRTNCNHREYPTEFQTSDEAWESLVQSLIYLRAKLGEARYVQLVDMTSQAKAHYDADEVKLGSWLFQDMEQIAKDRDPFAYPAELYRWPRRAAG